MYILFLAELVHLLKVKDLVLFFRIDERKRSFKFKILSIQQYNCVFQGFCPRGKKISSFLSDKMPFLYFSYDLCI